MSGPLRLGGVVCLAVSLGAGCAGDRDDDAFRLSRELGALGDEVARGVEASPDERGLAAAEALVAQRRPALRELARSLKSAPLGKDGVSALASSCASVGQMGMVARDYLRNARRPELVDRANALHASMESICAD